MVQDLLTVGFLILLEAALSADNALVLAIIVRPLPQHLHQRALLYGMAGALVFRGVAILLARWVLQIWWLQGMGAAYLAYLSLAHFSKGKGESAGAAVTARTFWPTVIAVELTDFAFAIDSILVAVAVSRKLWVIYLGAMIGTVAMRVAANGVIRLLNRYPRLEDMAYVLIAWIAVRLGSETWENYSSVVRGQPYPEHVLSPAVFWTGMLLIFLLGGWWSYRTQGTEDSPL